MRLSDWSDAKLNSFMSGKDKNYDDFNWGDTNNMPKKNTFIQQPWSIFLYSIQLNGHYLNTYTLSCQLRYYIHAI